MNTPTTSSQVALHDVIVVGGGPAGSTAAAELAKAGLDVLLLDRDGRVKPCGGAVPPQLLKDFDVPRQLLEAEIDSARMVSPSARAVDMPIDTGFVGMVDRGEFDEWLRERAVKLGATRAHGTFESFGHSDGHSIEVRFKPGKKKNLPRHGQQVIDRVRAKFVIGADGARSAVARAGVPGADKLQSVFAYHEIIQTPEPTAESPHPTRCDVIYEGKLSPDFYSWVFPHGKTISIGTGTAQQGFSLRQSISMLRERMGLADAVTVRCEGAPIPMKPLARWDDGKHVLLCGDAAGVVAPSSGEGIYYAMVSGQIAAQSVQQAIELNSAKPLRQARKQFLKQHGKVFFVLRVMQYFWYRSDTMRERFVTMCADKDVQNLTWEAYLNKKLPRRDPMAHVRIFIKDLKHLCRIGSAT